MGALIGVVALACANTAATPVVEPNTVASGKSEPTESKPSATAEPAPPPTATREAGGPAKPVASAKPLVSAATAASDSEAMSSLGVAQFFSDAPERDLYRLTDELLPPDPTGPGLPVESVTYAEGRKDNFWLINLPAVEIYQSEFELRHVTPHAYWYFETDLSAKQEDIERAAAVFEEQIYPRVTAAFGQEWTPGIDNDPHLNILNAKLAGLGGYYSSADEYPLRVNKFSNQREIIYINSSAIRVGTPQYSQVLAHELQHAIHWNADPSEDTWINEGLSELAVTVAGFGQNFLSRFSFSRPTSLVHWPLSPFGSGSNYGASSLFMNYFSEHYGDRSDLTPVRAATLLILSAWPQSC